VRVDEHEVATLAAGLDLLASDERLRETMGAAARDYAAREHGLAAVAERYAAALELAAGGGGVRDAVLREVAHAAAEVGIGADDPEAAELGRRLSELRLGQ